jgi:cold shock CspA family protein
LEEVLYPVVMQERIENGGASEIVNDLFVREKREYLTAGTEYAPVEKTSEQDAKSSAVSTILTLKEGFGFIKEEKRNNVFFYYDTLTNRDFDELEIGMKVEYFYEEDMERSKKEGALRYRAYKVTVIE